VEWPVVIVDVCVIYADSMHREYDGGDTATSLGDRKTQPKTEKFHHPYRGNPRHPRS
jgi:hypothetical protein